MRKLLFTLLLAAVTTGLWGQTSVRDGIEQYIKNEGYIPTIDDDGDIMFKVEGETYYISVMYEEDEDLYYVTMTYYLYSDDVSETQALQACNQVMRKYKLVQCCAFPSEDSDRIDYRIDGPCFAANTADYTRLFHRILNCVQTGRKQLVNFLYE